MVVKKNLTSDEKVFGNWFGFCVDGRMKGLETLMLRQLLAYESPYKCA